MKFPFELDSQDGRRAVGAYARRPKLFLGLGDPYQLIAVKGARTKQLAVRSWWPANILDWFSENRASFWSTQDISLATNDWAAFPEVGIRRMNPNLFPHYNTELVNSFSNFVTPSAQARNF